MHEGRKQVLVILIFPLYTEWHISNTQTHIFIELNLEQWTFQEVNSMSTIQKASMRTQYIHTPETIKHSEAICLTESKTERSFPYTISYNLFTTDSTLFRRRVCSSGNRPTGKRHPEHLPKLNVQPDFIVMKIDSSPGIPNLRL